MAIPEMMRVHSDGGSVGMVVCDVGDGVMHECCFL